MLEMYIWVYFVFCSKLMKNDVVVLGLLMNSWLIVVVAVMRCVVDELIPFLCPFFLRNYFLLSSGCLVRGL